MHPHPPLFATDDEHNIPGWCYADSGRVGGVCRNQSEIRWGGLIGHHCTLSAKQMSCNQPKLAHFEYSADKLPIYRTRTGRPVRQWNITTLRRWVKLASEIEMCSQTELAS